MDGVNFDIYNKDIRNALALNRVYGLKWEEISFSERLENPASGRKNIFFASANEALKVANFLNECDVARHADIGRQYSVVETRYDELRKLKDMIDGKPLDFKIYAKASDYFRVMRNTPAMDMESKKSNNELVM